MARLAPVVSLAVAFFFGGTQGFLNPGPVRSNFAVAVPSSQLLQNGGPSLYGLRANNDDYDDDRELSILEAEQGRLRAELEAARLKAELAKLQKERPQGDKSRGWTGSRGSPERQPRSEPPAEIRGPVSKRSGLQAAVPLSQRGVRQPTARKPGKEWGVDPSAPSDGNISPEKEQRYSQVVQELVSALQDVGKDNQVDVRKLVEGLKAARAEGGSSALQAAGPTVQENEMITAMRKGQGNALVQRIIGTGTLEDEEGQPPSKLERLCAWASLVVKTISSSKYALTTEKVMGMKDLVDRLLPRSEFTVADISVAHLAVIREIGTKIADDYPEIRRRRGNLLYVLLGLPGGGRSSGAAHQEEVAIGQYISMESSIGQGTRAVFESSLAEVLPSSTDAMALMDPKAFHRTAKALVDFGLTSRQVLAATRLPIAEATKGMTFFLVPWLRRVTKRVLEDTVNADATVRLGMIMELCVHAAESIALVQGMEPEDAEGFGRAIQAILAEKMTGIGVELTSTLRQMIFAAYVRGWLEEGLLGSSNAVSWQPAETGLSFTLSRRDVETWDLARQVLALSEVQLLFVAKETVPQVLGEVMCKVLVDHSGEWPRGRTSFSHDFDRVYRRLKYDKYEGDASRCKTVRVLADAVLSKTNDESMRQRAVEWGCETMELDTDKYAELAIEQATFELQAEVLDQMLGAPVPLQLPELEQRVTQRGAALRLPEANIGKATAVALQMHVGNLAARALFADMEGQPVKAFKEIENTLAFIDTVAAAMSERFDIKIDPVARIPDDDGLQLANICTKMLSRKQFTDGAKRFLEMLGYDDRIF